MGNDRPKHGYALVVVHYHDVPAAQGLLLSTPGWSVPPSLIVVADNSGDFPDEVPGAAAEMAVLRTGANLGYGGAVNRALALVRDEGFGRALVATQDCRLEPAAAALLLAVAQARPDAVVVGPLLTYASRPETVFSAGGRLTPFGRTLHPHQGLAVAALDAEGPHAVDWLDGACLLVDLGALAGIGDFDERYFLYVEEVDLQFRLRAAGYVCMLVPQARGSQEPGPYSLYYKYRNLCSFTARNRGRLRLWPWYLALPKDSLRMARMGRLTEPFWAIRGLVDWKRGRMGAQPSRIWAR